MEIPFQMKSKPSTRNWPEKPQRKSFSTFGNITGCRRGTRFWLLLSRPILIYTIVTAKESALSVLFINGYSEMDTEAFMSGFDEYAQIDTEEYATSLEMNFTIQEEATDQYTMANVQKLMALVAAKELDVIMADTSSLHELCGTRIFLQSE